MPTEIKLPHLGESIDSSVILAWHKQVGDVVKRGDELADLETDKATLSLEAPKSGVLLAISCRSWPNRVPWRPSRSHWQRRRNLVRGAD